MKRDETYAGRDGVSEHVPGVAPRPKMDTPEGLFGGTCSCGWASTGLDTERGAMKSAQQHADRRNAQDEHAHCVARWDRLPPDIAAGTTYHGLDAHLPRR